MSTTICVLEGFTVTAFVGENSTPMVQITNSNGNFLEFTLEQFGRLSLEVVAYAMRGV